MFDLKTERELRSLAETTTGDEFKEKVVAMLGENYDKKVCNIFQELGITENVIGYQQLWEAIIYCLNNEGGKYQIKNLLYPALAEMFKTKPAFVKQKMNEAIEAGYEKSETHESFRKYCESRGKPTDERFIRDIVTWIQHNM